MTLHDLNELLAISNELFDCEPTCDDEMGRCHYCKLTINHLPNCLWQRNRILRLAIADS